MADHAMFLSAFHGKEVNNLATTPAAYTYRDVGVADNECAHALLLLATAATQVEVQDSRKRSMHSTADGDAQPCCYGNPDAAGCSENSSSSSILKRQLQKTPVRCRKTSSMSSYDGSTAVKIECESGEYLCRLLGKRIKLDHNYALEPRFKEAFEKDAPKQRSSDAPGSSNRYRWADGKREVIPGNKTPKKSPPGEHRYASQKGLQKSSPPSSAKGCRPVAAQKAAALKGDPYDFQDEDNQSLDSGSLSMHSKLQSTEPGKASPGAELPDLYQPNDSKYKNFNLLLRCLTTEVESPEDTAVHFVGRRRCNTVGSSSTQDICGSEEGLVCMNPGVLPDYNEHQCQCCFKVFSRKRYLTKHVSRMHPETDNSEGDKDDMVSCPNCTHVISRRNFKRHSHVCNAHLRKSKKQLEMDLANCQFCGIRMRRHILVKHLAQEHCVENVKAATAALFAVDEGYLDSDSSTLSGSDNEDEHHSPSKDLMMCNLCNVLVRRALIKQHVQEKHRPATNGSTDSTAARLTANTSAVSCQLCGVEVTRSSLMKHLAEVHCAADDNKGRGVNGQEVSNPNAAKTGSGCTHSMLQRFLSDSSGDLEAMEPTDQCQSCISGLVKLASLTTVNGSPRAGSCSPADLTLANGASACVTSRDTRSSLSPPRRSAGTVQDSCSERLPV